MSNTYIYNLNVNTVNKAKFYECFGKDVRLEVLNSAMGIGKIQINLQKFNKETHEELELLKAYIDVLDALLIANDILTGRYSKLAAAKPNEITCLFEAIGGTSADKANRADGKALYRQLKISRGKKWMIQIVYAPGKETSTGGFVADGKAEKTLSIGMDDNDFKKFALAIQTEYQAYRNAQMIASMNQRKSNYGSRGDLPY